MAKFNSHRSLFQSFQQLTFSLRRVGVNIIKRNFTRKEEKKIMTYAEQLRFEGRSEGRSEGIVEGRAEGRTEATRNVAIKLLQRNSEPDVVASVTDLPLTQILELRKKIRSSKK